MIDDLAAAASALSVTEVTAVALAIAYLVLAVRENILCWSAAFLSSCLYIGVFFQASLFMESLLQVFYAATAVYGWYQWRHGGVRHAGARIHTWPLLRHVVVVAGIVSLSLLVGWGMAHTSAAFPYADSFTTVAAVVTTFMVARKVLENWVYWFVIDGISVYLYAARELHLTALLFVLYLVLIIVGYRRWWQVYRRQSAEGESLQGGAVA